MVELELATPEGPLRTLAISPQMARAVWSLVEARRDALPSSEIVTVEPEGAAPLQAYLKADRLRGRARWRHGLRAALLTTPPPRLREYANLTWLRERLFGAPRPLAAGVVSARGLPALQYLATEVVPDARTLRELLESDADPAQRRDVLDDLAREVARLHALHFVHHDLYPRNVLVAPGTTTSIVFIDAWAGGPGVGMRGAAYDLGTWMLHGAELLTQAEQQRFLSLYFAERTAQGRPVDPARFLTRVVAERRALASRLQRRAGERRGRPAPALEWTPPLLESPASTSANRRLS